MPHWAHTLRVADVWRNEDMPFPARRDEIVRRIKASRFWDADDYDLEGIVSDLQNAEDVRGFDAAWEEFYYWADDQRVWVETF